jgi:Glycosyl transferases group 1
MLNSWRPMRVFYYAPDTQTPSWGVGMLYTHVKLLRASGIEAAVLHKNSTFRPEWLDIQVPCARLGNVAPDDVVVVPEIFAARPEVLSLRARRVVFVQASSFIELGLRGATNYRELRYDGVMATMPHVQQILKRHYGVDAAVAPPCIAPYFFLAETKQDSARKRQLVLHPKAWHRDLSFVQPLLEKRARSFGWRIVLIERRTHREVARVFRRAALHVNVNCQESFNAMVPEAMAAGCVSLCYEAFGGRDYLRNGKNAFVFPTHHAYPLVEKAVELMEHWDSREDELRRLRRNALATARRYTEESTRRALVRYFGSFSGEMKPARLRRK